MRSFPEQILHITPIYAIKNLKSLGMWTAEKKLEYATKEALSSLTIHIGIITERRFGDVTIHTINSLRAIGGIAAENGAKNGVWVALEYIGRLGRTAVENGDDSTAYESAKVSQS